MSFVNKSRKIIVPKAQQRPRNRAATSEDTPAPGTSSTPAPAVTSQPTTASDTQQKQSPILSRATITPTPVPDGPTVTPSAPRIASPEITRRQSITPAPTSSQQDGQFKRRRVERDKGIAIQMPGQMRGDPVARQGDLNATPSATPAPSRIEMRTQAEETEEAANAEEPVDGAMQKKEKRKRSSKKRAKTPENADTVQIDPGVAQMGDLCKDTFIGKKSKRYEEIEKLDWTKIIKEQRQKKAERAAAKEAGQEVQVETVNQRLERMGRENQSQSQPQGAMIAPQMRLVNGQLVLDEQSMQIDRRERDAIDQGPMELIEESNLTRRVNSGTWGRRERTERWDDAETEQFYRALSMFGTDFELISKMFLGRSRRMLKNKFNIEERRNPTAIDNALRNKTPVNLGEYSRIVGKEFRPVEEVEEQLQKIRDEHAAELEALKTQTSELVRERNAAANATLAEEMGGNTADLQAPGKRSRKMGKKGGMKFANSASEEVIIGSIA